VICSVVCGRTIPLVFLGRSRLAKFPSSRGYNMMRKRAQPGCLGSTRVYEVIGVATVDGPGIQRRQGFRVDGSEAPDRHARAVQEREIVRLCEWDADIDKARLEGLLHSEVGKKARDSSGRGFVSQDGIKSS
jgi:hypothetical protein